MIDGRTLVTLVHPGDVVEKLREIWRRLEQRRDALGLEIGCRRREQVNPLQDLLERLLSVRRSSRAQREWRTATTLQLRESAQHTGRDTHKSLRLMVPAWIRLRSRSMSGRPLTIVSKYLPNSAFPMRSWTASSLQKVSVVPEQRTAYLSLIAAASRRGEQSQSLNCRLPGTASAAPTAASPRTERGDTSTKELQKRALDPALRVLEYLDMRERLSVEDERLACAGGVVDVEVARGDELDIEIELIEIPAKE